MICAKRLVSVDFHIQQKKPIRVNWFFFEGAATELASNSMQVLASTDSGRVSRWQEEPDYQVNLEKGAQILSRQCCSEFIIYPYAFG